jgi:hypothetical protein
MNENYDKTVNDNWGDPTRVSADKGNFIVEVTASASGTETEMNLSPKRAHKLAKALLKAAKVAEGNA